MFADHQSHKGYSKTKWEVATQPRGITNRAKEFRGINTRHVLRHFTYYSYNIFSTLKERPPKIQ